jgi:serine/threonine-protein kinase RCK2
MYRKQALTSLKSLGKQARAGNGEDPSPPHSQRAAQQKEMAAPVSEPLIGGNPLPPQQPVMDAYSIAPGDAQNRAAQAGNAAAHHAEAGQVLPQVKGNGHHGNLAQLVAEENASRSKFPRYPGLERWELVEKMGDGAFSNVYRARDREGDAGEVAIKVVRKYEMNNMQVRSYQRALLAAFL